MSDFNEMYSKLPNLIIGFHGCDESTFNNVIYKGEHLNASTNKYDWLGNGIYFWEQNYERALEWAKSNPKIKKPCVIGAIIDLGNCLNLTDSSYLKLLKHGYNMVLSDVESFDKVPENKKLNENDKDKIKRELDCYVIEKIHYMNKVKGMVEFDSVRAPFIEGNPIYNGSAFFEKTHIQICVRNPNCIKGYFNPLPKAKGYTIP